MAYQYDEMGNIIGEYESEEERKAREEAAAAEVHKQEVKTYGDGSQTVTSTQELPPQTAPRAAPQFVQQAAPQMQAAPVAQPTAPVMMPVAAPTPQAAPVRAVAAVPMQGQMGAISPEQMAYTQQMESGNRPDIGYHYAPGAEGQRKSTAYGAFGITAPAYADVQRANPAFAGRDITSLTPQEQQQAMQTYTGLNAQSLQRQGIEPSESNVRLAHFLGAKGAADYLNTGTISPAAAAANGGEARARQIAEQRLAGGNAPASGAAMQAAPAAVKNPSIAQYEAIQDKPIDLLKFREDASHPEWLREWAGNQASDLMKQEIDKKKAEKQATTLITGAATGDRKASNQIAQTLTSQDGSWLKMILLGFISPQMAGEEAIKLGFGNKTAPAINAAGETGLIQYNARGEPLKGTKSDGTTMTQPELFAYASEGTAAKTAANMPGVHGTPVQRMSPTGQVETGLMMYDPRTRQSYVQVGNQRKDTTGWNTMAQTAGAVYNAAAAKAQGTAAGEGFTPTPVPPMPGAAPAAMPAAPAALAPVAPGAMPAAAPAMAAPAAMPGAVAPVAPAAPIGTVAQQKLAMTNLGAQQTAYNKYVAEDVQPKADAGAQISRIRKDQLNGPDGILNNPELAGLMQGGKGEVGNIIRDLVTGNFKDQADLSQRVAALNLNDRQKDVLYKQIGLNAQINPLTLRANAGPGAISEAEHKINQIANVDITRQPLYSGLSLMTRDQFEKDLQVARNDFRSARTDISTTDQLNKAWNDEKRKAQQAYDGIYAARAAYIAKYNPTGATPGAVVDAFKYYPVPEWTGQGWDYKTDFARKAARPGLSSFNK